MALNKTMTFDLELKPGGIPPIVHASQGDIGRMFKANIYWDGSAATSYISGATVNLRGRKPDKTVFDYSATLAGSMVTFETTEQMTIISGPVECELVFSNDGDVIASANFVLMVEESPYDPNALSESVVPGIADLIEDTIGGDVRDEVDALITAHPELMLQDNAVTTAKIASGAVTAAKVDADFLKTIENAYVTPEMFGAVGDGTTDDTQAIIDAFNYCKTHKVYLYSPRKTYKTTQNCILDYGNNFFKIVLDGVFTYLEFRGNPAIMYNTNFHINEVTTCKFINFKGLYVNINRVSDFYLIADKTLNASGSCAYNTFTGISWNNLTVQSIDTGAWNNENKFYYMRCMGITITSDDYMNNNNRFYDVALENRPVTFKNALCNYIRARGEGGITVNETNSWNNIIERTYVNSKFGYTFPDTSPAAFMGNQIYKYLKYQNVYTLTTENYYHDDNDYATGDMKLKAWQKLADIYVKITGLTFVNIQSDQKNFRPGIRVLDETFTNITTSTDNNDVFRLTGATYTSGGDPYFTLGANQDANLIEVQPKTTPFWLKITISLGGSLPICKTIKADVGTTNNALWFVQKNYGEHLKSATTPTNTTYPLGTFVENSAGSSKGWIYTSSGWQTIT